ncbi:MAG: MoxR family ATPase [Planctomycetota bacterium]
MEETKKSIEEFQHHIQKLRQEIGKVIVGNKDIVDQILICLFSGGHALLEGVPGLGKTLLVNTLSKALNLKFSRIQFTPDLMPADIVGTNIVVEDEHGRKVFQFQKGPVFGNIVLTDEINRATPKTQSALLESMAEQTVTVAGKIERLPQPFFVLATQNPIDMEGTYVLPEAQLDRFFFKIFVGSPKIEELHEILMRTTGTQKVEIHPVLDGPTILEMRDLCRSVPIASHVSKYAVRIIVATHPQSEHPSESAKKYIRFGASPRGAQALILGAKVYALMEGRFNVSFSDIRKMALSALRHRLILNFEGEAEGITTDEIILRILKEVKEAPEEVEKLIPATA